MRLEAKGGGGADIGKKGEGGGEGRRARGLEVGRRRETTEGNGRKGGTTCRTIQPDFIASSPLALSLQNGVPRVTSPMAERGATPGLSAIIFSMAERRAARSEGGSLARAFSARWARSWLRSVSLRMASSVSRRRRWRRSSGSPSRWRRPASSRRATIWLNELADSPNSALTSPADRGPCSSARMRRS